MTDLELTRACAEAMGYEPRDIMQDTDFSGEYKDTVIEVNEEDYDPLHDDAQAMALVKRFHLTIRYNSYGVFWTAEKFHDKDCTKEHWVSNDDLNRAIVECVARMWAGRVK